MSDEEFLAAQTRQLARMPQDLLRAQKALTHARFQSKEEYKRKFAKRMTTTSFSPGELVLVRDVAPEKGVSIGRKTQNQYMGPYEIHRETQGGSYRLKELNGVHLENAIAAY